MTRNRVTGPGPRTIALHHVATLIASLLLASLVIACGTSVSPPASGASPTIGLPGSSGGGLPAGSPGALGPDPSRPRWPGTTVLAVIALGAADGEIQKAGADLQKAADTEDLKAMWGAADGLAKMIDGLMPNSTGSMPTPGPSRSPRCTGSPSRRWPPGRSSSAMRSPQVTQRASRPATSRSQKPPSPMPRSADRSAASSSRRSSSSGCSFSNQTLGPGVSLVRIRWPATTPWALAGRPPRRPGSGTRRGARRPRRAGAARRSRRSPVLRAPPGAGSAG